MKNTHQQSTPLRIKLFACLNIGVQSALPLAIIFTSVTAGAGSERHIFATTDGQSRETRTYTLSAGETPLSVAKKYNITPEALRKLNQLRTFAQGFDNLQTGDELDVPAAIGDRRGRAASTTKEDAGARKMADMASQAGTFLSGRPNADTALSMARDKVAAEASGQIQQWLNKFGTARVQLDSDEHFSLKNSQFDLLIPFYERKDHLIFTQGSLHRTDGRPQANLGLGLRYFTPSYMLGGNIFGDYDLSRNHARTGVGIEYWRDFLKLAANSYLRLTSWQDSPDIRDYQERPANGLDIRAQAWLPALPQLGGKLIYEQYFGNGVALFGKDSRQHNPHAIAAGINYTPFPLLTLGAEKRQGQCGKSDTRLEVGISYRPSASWQQQINPQAVAAMRGLAGSRYDLVERNNHMLLQYRKKDVIRLLTSARVTGYAGEQKSLGVAVNSKYGLERIDWSAPSLLAAGGKLVRENAAVWNVILPGYRSGAQAVNSWTVSGVAVDKKGNISARVNTLVTVVQAAIDNNMSSLSPATITLQADGKTQQQLVLKINDRDGKPVDIAEGEISVQRESKLRSASTTKITAFSRRAVGEYIATLTAGTVAESFTLVPSARNIRFAPTSVVLTANNGSLVVTGDISVTPASAVVGATVTYSAVLTDKNGNQQGAGIPVVWTANAGSILSAQSTSSDETGTAVVTLTRAQPGKAKVSLILPSGKYAAPDVVFSTDVPDEKRSELTLTPPVILAGKEPATLTLVLRDKNGNLLSAQAVQGQGDSSMVKIGDSKEIANKPGHYHMPVFANKAGKVTLSVNVNGKTFGHSKTLTITSEAITPDLRFTNAQQNVTWSKNFSASQAVSGIPDGVKQQWSSSDNSVATVDGMGKVTLVKSGSTTITVQTLGDSQYNPGQAGYELKIDKADPLLRVRDGSPIKARWADGIARSIAPTFGNADAENRLIATYTSKNSAVVTVADNGALQAVKPGVTSVAINTPETDQFKAASLEMPYLLEKGTFDIGFNNAEIKVTNEQTFTLQQTEKPVPSDAAITWTSSDNKVLEISSTGKVNGKVMMGKTRLTLSVAPNDYYHASSGYYDVLVYSKPLVSVGKTAYFSKGTMMSKGDWMPVFTDDKLYVTWTADSSNEFSKAQSVTVYLTDSGGKRLAQQEVISPAGVITTQFSPQASFWDKLLHIELVAQGYKTLIGKDSSAAIGVIKLPPINIWKKFTIQSYIDTRTNDGKDTSCQESLLGKHHHNYAITNGDKISFGGKTLLAPMLISAIVSATQNGSPPEVRKFRKNLHVTSDQSIEFGEANIAGACWKNHTGGYRMGVNINYADTTYTYWAPESHGWGGNGDGMYSDNIDNFGPAFSSNG